MRRDEVIWPDMSPCYSFSSSVTNSTVCAWGSRMRKFGCGPHFFGCGVRFSNRCDRSSHLAKLSRLIGVSVIGMTVSASFEWSLIFHFLMSSSNLFPASRPHVKAREISDVSPCIARNSGTDDCINSCVAKNKGSWRMETDSIRSKPRHHARLVWNPVADGRLRSSRRPPVQSRLPHPLCISRWRRQDAAITE